MTKSQIRSKAFAFPIWTAYFTYSEQIVLFMLVLLGVGIRTMNALSTQLWRDEIYIFFTSRDYSIWQLIMQQHWDTAHPPLHSILLHFWQMISIHPFWLRLPSLIASFLILYLIPILAVKITPKPRLFPFIFLLIFSLSHTQISLNMVVRPYPFIILLTISSLILFLSLIDQETKRSQNIFYFSLVNICAIFFDYSTIWLFLTYLVFFCIYYLWRKNTSRVKTLFRGLAITGVCSLGILPLLLGNIDNTFRLEQAIEPIKSEKPTLQQGKTIYMSVRRVEKKVYIYDDEFKLLDVSILPSDPFPDNTVHVGFNMSPLSILTARDVSLCPFHRGYYPADRKALSACRFKPVILSLRKNTVETPSSFVLEFLNHGSISLINTRGDNWETSLYKKVQTLHNTDDLLLRLNLASLYLHSPTGVNIFGRTQTDPVEWWKDVNRFTISPTEGSYRIVYYDGSTPNERFIFGARGILETFSGGLLFFSGFPDALNTYVWLVLAFILICISQLYLLTLVGNEGGESFLLIILLFFVPISLSIAVSYFFIPIFLGRNLHLSNIAHLGGLSLFIASLYSREHRSFKSLASNIAFIVFILFFLFTFLFQFPYIHYVDPPYDSRGVAHELNKDSLPSRKVTIIMDNERYYFPLIQYYLLLKNKNLVIRLIQYNQLKTMSLDLKPGKRNESLYFLRFDYESFPHGGEFEKMSKLLGCSLHRKEISYIYFAKCE